MALGHQILGGGAGVGNRDRETSLSVDRAQAFERVASARVGRLATVTSEGRPHVVPCCFVLDDDTIYSAVDAKTKKTLDLRRLDNIRRYPVASLLVDHYADDWSELWWVRIDGTAQVVGVGDERDRALGMLSAKYPPYREMPPPGPVIVIQVDGWRAWP
jgi:PPOX class probable F420-dependent enzyme